LAKGRVRRPTEDQALARCKHLKGGDPDIREVMDRDKRVYKIWLCHHYKDTQLGDLYVEWLHITRGTPIRTFMGFLRFYGFIYQETQIRGPRKE